MVSSQLLDPTSKEETELKRRTITNFRLAVTMGRRSTQWETFVSS